MTLEDPATTGGERDAGVSSVQAQVDSVGFGLYQVVLLVGVGASILVEAMEMGIVSPLHTALARAYALSRKERAILPAMTYTGSMVGMVVAGPLADLWGRKRTLVLAQVLLCIVSCVHAVLPAQAGVAALVALRICAGVAGAVGIPTAISLAVESCAQKDRVWMVFGTNFLGSLGFFVESLGVQWFMPHFGEAETDNWRGLCLFCGIPAFATLPLVLMLQESPTFLAINGRWNECMAALDQMSRWNGRPRRHGAMQRKTSNLWKSLSFSETRSTTLWGLALHYLPILVILVAVDSLRSFFVSGSAYLCKDLFELTRLNQSVSPTILNVIASVSPLVGLLIGERFLWIGVRSMTVACSVVAAVALVLLMVPSLRGLSWLLLTLVLCYKLTYGPISSCISVMKVEAFPTEFRATAFATICIAGKLLAALGPTLVEALKAEEAASSWNPWTLAVYLLSLAAAVLLCGLLSLLVPVTCSQDGLPLKDFSKLEFDSDEDIGNGNARAAAAACYASTGKKAEDIGNSSARAAAAACYGSTGKKA